MTNIALARILIGVGAACVIVGLVFLFADKIPFVGKLPGDIYVQKKNFSFYFPITTSIIISIILSVILWIFAKK